MLFCLTYAHGGRQMFSVRKVELESCPGRFRSRCCVCVLVFFLWSGERGSGGGWKLKQLKVLK